MAYENEKLNQIYSKTDGYCHICHKKLAFVNYGANGAKGSWHVEHSKPKAKGGTNHMNNLYAACISCNIEKGTSHTKTARAKNGTTRAPYSKEKKQKIKTSNTVGGATIGGGIGWAIGGPVGGLVGSLIGGAIGSGNSPKK
jgi:5-methylcytosine-specific restriction endonuclease McrA